MAHTSVPEVFSGVARIKWWRYRYMLIALLITNAFIIHHFFLDRSISSLNPFYSSPEGSEYEVHPPSTVSNNISPPTQQPESVKPAADVEKPADAEHTHDETKPSSEAEKPTESETPPQGQEEHKDATDAEKLAAQPPPPAEPPKPKLVVPSYAPVKFVPPPASQAAFILGDYDFNGEYTGWPLKRVCKESTYTPGLVYICDNNSGGIGNIRNFILTCIRYAIEAGASGLIMPRIQRRSEETLGVLFTASFQPFSYFFDEEHFRTVMERNCPQITIYDSLEVVPHAKDLLQAKEFYPKDLTIGGDGCDDRGVNRHLDHFRVKHDQWIQKYHRMPNATAPVSVRFRWAVFFEWPIYRDGPEFAVTFGDILRIRSDIDGLAATAIDQLVSLVHGDSSMADRKKLDAPYLGVHLRTESDALGFWPDYETQALGYLDQAGKRGLKHAYIASGNATEGHRFGDLAMEHLGMKVVGKTDLLKGKDLKALNKLSWDQQALVDFLVLTKSAHFTGCSFSSFSMNIAIRRHTMTEGIKTRQWKSPGDAYSTLVGRFDNWFGDWMFMYECLWP